MNRGKYGRPARWPYILIAALLALATGAAAFLWTHREPEETEPVSAPVIPEDISEPVPEPEPIPAPAPAPEPEKPEPEPDPAERLLAEMSLREKICQLFIVSPESITGVTAVTAAGDTTREALETYPVCGFLYAKKNMVSQEQLRTMLTSARSFTRIPLLFTCDEEGGRANRLMGSVGTTWFGPMLRYKDQGPDVARENARTIGADMASCCFNMNFAPVADVWSNPDNRVIGNRAYSDSFQQAAELVAAAVEGFHEGGVACTLKHFPGHGDTSADSHYGSVYVHKTLDELRQAELLPFQAGIDAGVDAVMMGHLILDQVDGQPALFSHAIVTELLREEMGFDGVVITDSLEMQAMTDFYGSGEIAVSAVQAGVDILLCPMDLDASIEALTQAVESGEITLERLEESVLRILRLKLERGILEDAGPETAQADAAENTEEAWE